MVDEEQSVAMIIRSLANCLWLKSIHYLVSFAFLLQQCVSPVEGAANNSRKGDVCSSTSNVLYSKEHKR